MAEQSLFRPEDLAYLREFGHTADTVLEQIELFKKGMPFTVLQRPCTVGDGITVWQPDDLERFALRYAQAAAAGRVTKFVPASGAASRMFRQLLACLERYEQLDAQTLAAKGEQDEDLRDLRRFLDGLPRLACYDRLQAAMAADGLDLEALLARGQYRDSLEYLLTDKGLDYANLPKALLEFHRYADHNRTPLEEHLVEAAVYAQDGRGVARVHFTTTLAHQEAMQAHFEQIRHRYERDGVRFEVSLSIQKPSTDTMAVNLDNTPFRDRQGRLVLRPGGHGALLRNLHELAGDIVFIKNIDNVVPDRLKHDTYVYKRALGGCLVDLQQRIHTYLRRLCTGEVDTSLLAEASAFARQTLSIETPPHVERQSRQERIAYLVAKLNRPLRVCGMVQNTGEPGGGPFWVRHADGSCSLQLVETSQVNMRDEAQRAIVDAATHFSPVDLVGGLRDYQGELFDLSRFVDPDTAFISRKSHEGRDIRALEWPGLWNGGMAHWNTVFVEVPLSTFSPAKTVLDLLRPQHQP